MNEDKRISDRRTRTRRVYDMLQGSITEEERQAYDRLLYRNTLSEDRRVNDRRSGAERRKEEE